MTSRGGSVRVLGVLVAAVAALALGASTASASSATVSIQCGEVDIIYSVAADQFTVNESITIDGNVYVDRTVTKKFPGKSFFVFQPRLTGTHTIAVHADWTADGGGSVDKTRTFTCTPPPSPCPSGTKLNFRWHYSAHGTSGSWSGTQSVFCPGSLSMGPQSMEGDLKVTPGETIMAGYSFTAPGNNSTFQATVKGAKVVFTVRCVSGATPSQPTFAVPMTDATYTVTDSSWYPSGDQHSSLVYQGSKAVPDLCGGGQLRLDKGGTFTAAVS